MLKDRKSFLYAYYFIHKNDAFFCLFKSVMLILFGVNYKNIHLKVKRKTDVL